MLTARGPGLGFPGCRRSRRKRKTLGPSISASQKAMLRPCGCWVSDNWAKPSPHPTGWRRECLRSCPAGPPGSPVGSSPFTHQRVFIYCVPGTKLVLEPHGESAPWLCLMVPQSRECQEEAWKGGHFQQRKWQRPGRGEGAQPQSWAGGEAEELARVPDVLWGQESPTLLFPVER